MAHEARLARNDESRNRAEHYREEWTAEEDEFLQAFWKDADEAEVAEILGRTIEACRQRFYVVRRGEASGVTARTTSTTAASKGAVYLGIHDDPDDQWWSPDYYTKGK